ncbi:hypothetical protein HGM15179_006660 [Zosterops borbonicus]|uniref:Uncharacterized protein n=1 Tax=Zosterops borbonicus TaxID=364589 RepID=A0A8K1GK23_9PASS|nr:hypothetical protein HGM15179_006660 [Zosterops borbonicus]
MLRQQGTCAVASAHLDEDLQTRGSHCRNIKILDVVGNGQRVTAQKGLQGLSWQGLSLSIFPGVAAPAADLSHWPQTEEHTFATSTGFGDKDLIICDISKRQEC